MSRANVVTHRLPATDYIAVKAMLPSPTVSGRLPLHQTAWVCRAHMLAHLCGTEPCGTEDAFPQRLWPAVLVDAPGNHPSGGFGQE